MEFEKLSAPSLKELFIQQMQHKILSGELPMGTRLPPERELARQMQVSRAVVNGGLTELASQGFLEIHPRQGTLVADYRRKGNTRTLMAIMDYKGGALGKDEIRSLIEVRQALEHLVVRNVILHASSEAFRPLEEILHRLQVEEHPQQAAELAFEFQHQLAVTSGNTVLPLIYYSFRSPMVLLWSRFCRMYGARVLYQNTEQLYHFIQNRDLSGAQKWINTYLDQAIHGNRQIYATPSP